MKVLGIIYLGICKYLILNRILNLSSKTLDDYPNCFDSVTKLATSESPVRFALVALLNLSEFRNNVDEARQVWSLAINPSRFVTNWYLWTKYVQNIGIIEKVI